MTYAYVRFSNLPQDTPSSLCFHSKTTYASLQTKIVEVLPDKEHACILTMAVEIEPGSNLFYIRNRGYRLLTPISYTTASTIRHIMNKNKHITHICIIDRIISLLQQLPELSNIEPISITLITHTHRKNIETYIDLYPPMRAPNRTIMDYLRGKPFVPELLVRNMTPMDAIKQDSSPTVSMALPATQTAPTQPTGINNSTGVISTSTTASNASQEYQSTTTSLQASADLASQPSTAAQASGSAGPAITALKTKNKRSHRPIQTIHFSQKKPFYQRWILQDTYDKRPYTTIFVCSVCIILMLFCSTALLSIYLKGHITAKWTIISLACTLPIQMLIFWRGYQATRQPVVVFPSIANFHSDCLIPKDPQAYTFTTSIQQVLQTPSFIPNNQAKIGASTISSLSPR